MRALLIVVMLTVCSADLEDLTGKSFSFTKEGTDYVRLMSRQQDFTAITLCLRSFTDLNRMHSLFSLSTPSSANDFLIFKDDSDDEVQVHARNVATIMRAQEYKRNTWQSVCYTWDGKTGLVQLWLDGRPSARKFCSQGTIRGTNAIIIIGQEQDSHGGRFDIKQSFVGMQADIHMWNFVLSPCELQRYVDDLNYTPGNVINWKALEYSIKGNVLLVDKNSVMPCLARKIKKSI